MYKTINELYEDWAVNNADITTDQKLICKLYERYVLNTSGSEYGHVMARVSIFDDMVKVISANEPTDKLKQSKLSEDMEATDKVLKMAIDANLETETVCWSMMYMRDNPGASIVEGLQYGFDEWVNK